MRPHGRLRSNRTTRRRCFFLSLRSPAVFTLWNAWLFLFDVHARAHNSHPLFVVPRWTSCSGYLCQRLNRYFHEMLFPRLTSGCLLFPPFSGYPDKLTRNLRIRRVYKVDFYIAEYYSFIVKFIGNKTFIRNVVKSFLSKFVAFNSYSTRWKGYVSTRNDKHAVDALKMGSARR